MNGDKNWLTELLANPVVLRVARYLALLLAGAALEQVTRLGVLPPEAVEHLRHALSVLS